MKQLLILAGLGLLLACNQAKPEQADQQPPSTDTSARATITSTDTLAWPGMYKGTTPCADCPGIETTLTLNPDSTYVLNLVYVDAKNKAPVEAKGRFRWMPGTNTVVLDGLLNMPSQYSVGQNMLMQMDMTGQPIAGPNAASYILMKQNLQEVTIMKQ
jgi:uncharacterized lipoprotein NlpE involved in copper resistance